METVLEKKYYVYILTTKFNKVLYVGVTGNLSQRIEQHKSRTADSFTNRYDITKLVYYEVYDDVNTAILREKQLKGGSRQKKIDIVTLNNPDWEELYV